MEYLTPLINSFEQNADEKNAFAMSKYMRNKFPFYGIKTPLRTELVKKFLKEFGYPDNKILTKVIKYAWAKPQREVHYSALDILYKTAKTCDKKRIELIEFLVLHNSWWDTVDSLAKHTAFYFLRHPDKKTEVIERWMNSGNIWLQRICVIHQLLYKDKTDFALMHDLINRLKDSDEFFIQKGIGWALREYSKTNREAVKEFINSTNLEQLSVREGSKYL